MPTVLTEALAAVRHPESRTWTRAEVLALDSMGAFEVDDRFELVDGELIKKPGKNKAEGVYGWHLVLALIRIFGVEYVNVEIPIDVSPSDNERSLPVPDAVVLRHRNRDLPSWNPKPEDLWLVAEVADSTLTFDCTRKAALYARAGIVEYWVLDVRDRALIVHRSPRGGEYESVTTYAESESVEPLGAPERRFAVSEAFPV